jgi:hypothetical protein
MARLTRMRSALICGCVFMLAAGLLGCGSSGTDTSTGSSVGAGITVPGGPTSTGGASASGPSATSTVPANASFAARADAVCARYQTQRRAIFGQLAGQFRQSGGNGRGSGGNGDIAQRAAGAYRQVAASGRRELDELWGLPAPASQANAIQDYFSSVETTLGDIDKLAAALDSSPSGALRSVGPEIRADGLKTHGLAEGLGLRVCGELR